MNLLCFVLASQADKETASEEVGHVLKWPCTLKTWFLNYYSRWITSLLRLQTL